MTATIKETFALAYQNHQKNNLKIAEKLYKEVLKINPNHFESIFLLGTLSAQSKKFDKAQQLLSQAITINPNHVDAHNNLGNVLKEVGEREKAISSYEKAIQIQPNFAAAHNNLGALFMELDEHKKAASYFQKAIQIQPNFAGAHNNLGSVLKELEPQKAISCYEKAIQIDPNYAEAYYNFGNVLRELCEYQKAINYYEKAINVKPDHVKTYNNILFTSLHFEKDNPNFYLSKAKEFRSSLKPIADQLLLKYQYDDKPKKLKIGFVSADLREHPVGFFLLDTLKYLSSKNLELIAYSNSSKKDGLSDKLKSYFTNWREVSTQNDVELTNQIRKDGIHILFDLSGHSGKNRLPIFINRPAPIQVSWAGYNASTGIPEIDYFIGDPIVTPASENNHYVEKIFQLPNIWVCFTAPDFEAKLSQLSAIKNGYITFGCFNNLSKINDKVISLWSKILKAVPKSKIFLKTSKLNSLYFKKKIINNFQKNNIGPESIILEGSSPRNELLASYNKVDIALDSFPYSGNATSFEAIWMGVPVLTKKGSTFISHSTESINYNCGMSDWIAKDENEYLTKAIKFSANFKQLSEIKMNLRKTALNSPLFKATLFADQFNEAVWKMWNNFN